MPHCVDVNQRHYCSSFQPRGESEWESLSPSSGRKEKVFATTPGRRLLAGSAIADGALPPKSKEEVQVLSAELRSIVLISRHLHSQVRGCQGGGGKG